MEAKVQRLQAKMEEKDEMLVKAGQLGNQLLERISELEEEIEKGNKEHAVEIEKLEQEKYSLQLKLEQKTFSELNYSEEVDSLKETLRREREEYEQRLETVNQSELASLRAQLSCIRNDCEKAQLSERQLRERNSELEELLDEAQERVRQKVLQLNETTSEEIASLHSDIATLQNDKVALLRELGDVKDASEHARLQLESARKQLAASQQELEQLQCQATSYFNALEKAREEAKELRTEIEILRMEGQDQKKKGNSLFSEVEDRRIEAEKQLISMKVQTEALRKQHEASRGQISRLKMQLAGLLQMSGRQADADHIDRLERQLMQARCEVDILSTKLHNSEQNQRSGRADYEKAFRQQQSDNQDSDYAEFLKVLLDKKEKELSEREKQLDSKSLMLIQEGNRLVECERKLYAAERQIKTLQAQCIKQTVRIEELTAKYEPEKLASRRRVRKTITEQIPLSDTEGESTDQSDRAKLDDEERITKNLLNSSKSSSNKTEAYMFTANKENNHDQPRVDTEKQPLNEIEEGNVKNTDHESGASEVKKRRYELKSVKVKKVSIAEGQGLEDVCDLESDANYETIVQSSHQEKNKKPAPKIFKMADTKPDECQMQ